MASLGSTDSVCTEVALAEYRDYELFSRYVKTAMISLLEC